MIEIAGIDLFHRSNRTGFQQRFDGCKQPDRNARSPEFPLHKAIERLYSDRLKNRFTDVLDSDLLQSSRAPRNEGLYSQYLELLQAHLPARDKLNILDVGCGSGRFCQSLFDHGYRVYGTDRSHLLLQQARQNAPGCEFERASAYVPFKDLFLREFDAMVYLEAIEHLGSPRLFIRRAFESLAPGGILIVTARYRGYLLNLTSALAGPAPGQEAPLERDATAASHVPTTLGRVLEHSGLEIVEFQKAGRLPQPWRSQLFVARKPLCVTVDSTLC